MSVLFSLLRALVFATLVPGTVSTYTEGGYTWAGNEACYASGFLLSSASPAIDQGAKITGFHCASPGPAINQAKQADGSYCVEWYGVAPDIGACEFVPTVALLPPSNLQATP